MIVLFVAVVRALGRGIRTNATLAEWLLYRDMSD